MGIFWLIEERPWGHPWGRGGGLRFPPFFAGMVGLLFSPISR
ncbi:hypothetical protein [Shewanella sp.]